MHSKGFVLNTENIVSVKSIYIQSGLSPQRFFEILAQANIIYLQSFGPSRMVETDARSKSGNRLRPMHGLERIIGCNFI